MQDTSKHNLQRLQQAITKFQRPVRLKSIWQLLNTLIPFLLLWYAGLYALEHSPWLTIPVVILLAGFLVRIFIISHDCGHGSFFRSKRANDFWGRVTGVLTLTPYSRWRASHARHHGTSGNLDKRGEGDIWMLTLKEYLKAPRSERIKYRLYRNPLVMFLLGPLSIIFVDNRIAGKGANRRDRMSVYTTNLAIAAIGGAVALLVGWKEFLTILLPSLFLAHVVGVWLFYVQHQFEGVYWRRNKEWDFMSAALEGGSFYKLPGILRWFTGSIGYHHLHHLNSRIPNYRLAHCQQSLPTLKRSKPIGLRASLKSLTYRLWDEDSGQLISFRDAKQRQAILDQETQPQHANLRESSART